MQRSPGAGIGSETNRKNPGMGTRASPARLANRERWSRPCSKRHSMLLPRTVGSVDNSRDLSIRGTRPRLPTCYCVSQASPLPAWDAGGPGRPEQQPGVSLPGHECMANSPTLSLRATRHRRKAADACRIASYPSLRGRARHLRASELPRLQECENFSAVEILRSVHGTSR